MFKQRGLTAAYPEIPLQLCLTNTYMYLRVCKGPSFFCSYLCYYVTKVIN